MKRPRQLIVCAAAAVLAAAGPGATSPSWPPSQSVTTARQTDPASPAGGLPVLKLHRYRMDGRIRPLLFWIGRNDVGMGEIVWRGSGDEVAYELLIGTDAAKAPRGINRWGYILEETSPSGTRVLGVITTSDEATLSEVSSKSPGQQRTGRFKGIDARISAGMIRSATETLETERDFSIRDKDLVVDRIIKRLNDTTPREAAVPDGVRPGFLIAVAELVNNAIAARQAGGGSLSRLKGRTIKYTYNRRLYDLEMTGVEAVRPAAGAGPSGSPVHADFETTNHSTGGHSTFELEFATDGPLAGVPTLIRHRPRWWLEAVLTLADATAKPAGSAALPPAKH